MVDFYLLGNATECQMFGAVIKTKNKTIVIDGGTKGDGKQLVDFLSVNCNMHVDAWFFTHPHHDHIGAFYEMHRTGAKIQIDKIYHSFPSLADMKKYGSRNEEELTMWDYVLNLFENDFKEKICILKKDDIIYFDDVKIKILRVYNSNIIHNYTNNSSLVFRIDSPKKSVLILGDLGEEGGNEVIENCLLSDLQTDYVQLSHHGQCGVSGEFYKRIKPQACIWASPHWLWNNDSGTGFDTGPWQTVKTRKLMESLGVKENIIEKDGTQKIQL